ncbi:MAG: phasin family protein [Lysobacterales bacterium]
MKTMNTSLTQSIQKANTAARELRLAGLGIISRVRSNASSLFAELVDEGQDVQDKATQALSGSVQKLRQEIDGRVQIRSTVQQAREQAAAAVSKNSERLESMVQNQLTKVLGLVGVPSKSDIKKLDSRVATLRREIRSIKPKQAKAA